MIFCSLTTTNKKMEEKTTRFTAFELEYSMLEQSFVICMEINAHLDCTHVQWLQPCCTHFQWNIFGLLKMVCLKC